MGKPKYILDLQNPNHLPDSCKKFPEIMARFKEETRVPATRKIQKNLSEQHKDIGLH